ncbi:MAG: histidinol-phosphatase [Spirochaetota bacterium]
MIKANYHTHTSFCDGSAEPEIFVQEAIKRGFKALGFSGHAPLPYKTSWTMNLPVLSSYCETIAILREKYRDKIQIYLGLEVDYIPGIMGPSIDQYKQCGLDYIIGSVHHIQDHTNEYIPTIDGTYEEFLRIITNLFKGNMKALVQHYYKLVREMLTQYFPDILGHFDLVKCRNDGEYAFSEEEPWYRAEILKTLDVMVSGKTIMEINTGGYARKKVDAFYPSEWILAECLKRNIPVTISSDAHTPEHIDALFQESVDTLRRIGFKELSLLLNNTWTKVELVT